MSCLWHVDMEEVDEETVSLYELSISMELPVG